MNKPDDVKGQCNAHLYIGDDNGYDHATMRCSLEKGHKGKHQELFNRGEGQKVKITWVKDERDFTVETEDDFLKFLKLNYPNYTGISAEEFEESKIFHDHYYSVKTLIDEFFTTGYSTQYKNELIDRLAQGPDYYVLKEVNQSANAILNAKVVFGLAAQGHIPTIERMLKEGKSWEEIGSEIYWCADTAKKHYEWYLEKQQS